jgi:drug/metabolite transporter (DMT)-like permease
LAALIGVIWFKERPVLMRICAACVVAFGVILIALS